jgi:hypothetical protein
MFELGEWEPSYRIGVISAASVVGAVGEEVFGVEGVT